jgi:hypothetical protein
LYHSIPVNALLGQEFGNGLVGGDKEHDPRVGERRFVGRNAVWLFVDRDQMDLTDISDGRGGFGFGFDP